MVPEASTSASGRAAILLLCAGSSRPRRESRSGAARRPAAWHTHPHGQTIFVTEGVGLCQREGGPIEVIRPGDRVFFGPGENHWHGAAPDRLMVHIAMQQNDESGSPVTWGERVTDEQYGAARAEG
jgi:mannose-6-phosphate isomerase-like protein (cupin superfamily)